MVWLFPDVPTVGQSRRTSQPNMFEKSQLGIEGQQEWPDDDAECRGGPTSLLWRSVIGCVRITVPRINSSFLLAERAIGDEFLLRKA